jgi:hypothetical protein
MPAGDVFGLDGFFLNKSNPITVSAVDINSTAAGAGITVVSGVLNATAGIATLTLSTAAGLSTTPFYVGAKIAVSGIGSTTGIAYTGYNGNFVVTGFAGTTTVSYATTDYVGGVTASISGQTGLVMLVTDTAVTNTTWSSAQTHGWFGGGHFFSVNNLPLSSVERVDFSNDTQTASTKGVLSAARGYLAATSNSNYGWYGGGNNGPSGNALSSVDRIDFSNDTPSASPRGPLGTTKAKAAATGNSNYGWFGGGYFTGSSSNTNTTVVRIDYSNDSGTSLARGPLVFASSTRAATGNSNYGWFGGATSDGSVSRIDFSNDAATASPRGPLSAAKYNSAATGNSNYGWWGGGRTSVPAITSTVNRIDFTNDTGTAVARGPLSSARYNLAATGNSNYGWFGGGANPGTTGQQTIDRIDFVNDSTSASPRGITPAPTARYGLAATSGQARSSSVRLQKAGNYGWFGGGYSATIDRIDFSNDSVSAAPRGPLSLSRSALAATGNSNYGWFGGGGYPQTSTVDRIDFSNDSSTASVRGPLSLAKSNLAATGNSNYGWFGESGTVERIDFSNDSVSAAPRGPLNAARYGQAATGNSNYGWFGGGVIGGTFESETVERINFSNDSVTASVRGSLTAARYYLAATGNSNYGWFGAGFADVGDNPVYYSMVDRIDFSNDSVTALRRSFLTPQKRLLAATGNSNYGWFGGGQTDPTTPAATVERINFANDSVTASPRGPLSSARNGLTATSNTPT